MKQATVPLPVIGLIAGTRAAGGAGIGMLLSDRIPAKRRRTIGWALFGVGLLTTIPLIMQVLSSRSEAEDTESRPAPELAFAK